MSEKYKLLSLEIKFNRDVITRKTYEGDVSQNIDSYESEVVISIPGGGTYTTIIPNEMLKSIVESVTAEATKELTEKCGNNTPSL